MCGILGIFKQQAQHKEQAQAFSTEQIIKAYEAQGHRGRDGYGFCTEKASCLTKDYDKFKKAIQEISAANTTKTILLHNLHAVVNQVVQPIQHNNKDNKKEMLAFNGEIYNWKELKQEHQLKGENDTEILLGLLDKRGVEKTLERIDGIYAFAYWNNDQVILARDILGEKPLFTHLDKDGIAFASEKKALIALGFKEEEIRELNPRHLVMFDMKTRAITTQQRSFFEILPEHIESVEVIKQKTKTLLEEAIKKRIPDKPFGILFSGGIDSTTLAFFAKKMGLNPICYTAVLDEEGSNMTPAEDLIAAQNTAQALGFRLKVKKIKLSEVEWYIKKIVPLIESTNVIKVGVALPFYVACEMAKEDGLKVIFSGLGSEEIFGGYERHEKALQLHKDLQGSHSLNKECLSGLLKMYERDLYRDDVITMAHQLELRLPFLDKKLVAYALKIPEQYKIKDSTKKWVLREIMKESGLPVVFAERKKRAAQYGSKFDKAIAKLAQQQKQPTKSAYLNQFRTNSTNLRLGALFTGGKDSTYAIYTMKRQHYDVACLITLKSKNQASYMFHTPNIHLVNLLAEAMQIPLVEQETEGEKEQELNDLRQAIQKAKDRYQLDGIITGALFSNYQRDRIEKICDDLGLQIFSPLWHKDQEEELREILNAGFSVVLSSIAADGLDKSWLGRILTEQDINRLVELHKKKGLNPAGEGGEFESLVLDGPDELFKKRIELVETKIQEESEHTAQLIVKKAVLQDKRRVE